MRRGVHAGPDCQAAPCRAASEGTPARGASRSTWRTRSDGRPRSSTLQCLEGSRHTIEAKRQLAIELVFEDSPLEIPLLTPEEPSGQADLHAADSMLWRLMNSRSASSLKRIQSFR